MQATTNYIAALEKVDISLSSEASLRTIFENFINEFIQEANLPAFKVLQEGKRIGHFGVPDFRISHNDSMLGYIETKKLGENLEKILKTEQIKKYTELSKNLIITNYTEFIWLKDASATLAKLEPEKLENLLLNFFSQVPEKISTPEHLAILLAVRCKNLKDFIHEELKRQDQENEQESRLLQLYNAFKDNIFAELTISEFADAFAQMLIYGFFLAGLNADSKKISIRDTKYYIPPSFQLIKELLNFLDELELPEYKETKWIIDETISIINNIEWHELKQNMSFTKKLSEQNELSDSYDDPYIYFYETFLAEYDYNLRKSKGVYYTPQEVVRFIVRSVDEILINTFNLNDGLAEQEKVTVLDFATGTGTFLLEVFKIILDKYKTSSNSEILSNSETLSKLIIKEHLLKNIYGFEYLIAPYTIAHLKLSQFLKENGYKFQDRDRLQVYLTNTLEPTDKQVKVLFMPQLSKETRAAQEIKDKPILVITGNPPYSGHSKNTSKWISNKIKDYFQLDGKPLKEQNSKWLQDDYVKFIRFAQDKIDSVEEGVVGIITNHSFLDNPTFRGMRQSLINSFDQLYFIDLHGNSKKKESTPDGSKDENVFDIQQGVSISLMIKKKGLKKGVFHADFFGSRRTKFLMCKENSFKTLVYKELNPNSPFYLFVPQNQDVRAVYEKFWSIKDIFEVNSVGIVTARDKLTMLYDIKTLKTTLYDFIKLSEYEARQKYDLGNDTRDWKVTWAQEDLRNNFIKEKDLLRIDESKIRAINYRPFDVRYSYYTGNTCGFHCMPRQNVMKHFDKDNLGLIFVRFAYKKDIPYTHVFVSDKLIDANSLFSGSSSLAPLYRYNGNGNGYATNYLFKEDDKKDNFTEQFRNFIKTKYSAKQVDKNELLYIEKVLKELEKQLKQTDKTIISLQKNNLSLELLNAHKQIKEELKTQIELKKMEFKTKNISQSANYEPTPEAIFYYIYAVLHGRAYREKYAEFLKMDFPRIPFVDSLSKFETLSKLGEELVKTHLLKDIPRNEEYNFLGNFRGEGDRIVAKPELVNNKLYINASQYFEAVSETVYNFQIGGYQVLDKYLKDRKNKELTIEEIVNVENIVKVLNFTIHQMELIDNELKDWILDN